MQVEGGGRRGFGFLLGVGFEHLKGRGNLLFRGGWPDSMI